MPTKLLPGEKPPQFVRFDGVGWDEMWQHWFRVASQVPFRFTGFLSGTYLLSSATRDDYHSPHYPAGTSAIGWTSPDDVPVEIDDPNRALSDGDEIGTHFNGHFCVGAGEPSGGNNWTSADWDQELDQFFALLDHVDVNNHLKKRLDVTADDVHGERTPCLEGTPQALYPALVSHHFDYDASFTRTGLSWPTRAPDGLWQLGMQLFPVHGRLPDGRSDVPVTSMDYNYFFTQRGASDTGLTTAQSRHDERQVLATYRDMYAAAYAGNRAQLVLGSHFNDWNHGAYVQALTRFVQETCGRPDAECVTMSDLVAWLEAQSPRELRQLQRLGRPVAEVRADDARLGRAVRVHARRVAPCGLATAMCIGAQLGRGPRDGLMTGLHRRTGLSLRLVRTGLEITVAGIGLLLGGSLGVGTVVFALTIGPLTQLLLPLWLVPVGADSAGPVSVWWR